MERDIAIRIDGMLMGVRGNLDGIARYMKNNLSDEEYSRLVKSIGQINGCTIRSLAVSLFRVSRHSSNGAATSGPAVDVGLDLRSDGRATLRQSTPRPNPAG